MYLAFYAVHTPIEAKPEYVEYFKKKAHKMRLDEIQPFTKDLDWYKMRIIKLGIGKSVLFRAMQSMLR